MKENLSIAELQNKCIDLKKNAVSMIYKAQSGHPGGSLSVAEFVTACYWHAMDVDPQNPRWADRDRFVLSKGHVCPAQYAALAMKGYFPMEVLDTLRKEGSPLQGHPSMTKCAGIDISTGSLGQGLACAVGMALAAKLDNKSYNVFCAVGDGECNEGQVWEACQTAGHCKLDHFILFVDWNKKQLDGRVTEVCDPGSYEQRFSAFGFGCETVKGYDTEAIYHAIERAKADPGRPHCIVLDTVKGIGFDFAEAVEFNHYLTFDTEQAEKSVAEIERRYAAGTYPGGELK